MTLLKILAAGGLAAGMGAGAVLAQEPGEHFLQNWDLDGNHAVDLKEVETRRDEVFSAFDADEDGFLSAEEYVFFDEARANDMAQANLQGQRRGMHRAAEGMRLEKNDIDGDGRVSREEFQTKVADWFGMLDRNEDGVVTTVDFGRGQQ